MRYQFNLFLLVLLLLGFQAQPPADELAWVGLFNTELVEWLENENRLGELCKGDIGAPEWLACRAAKRETRVLVIPVTVAARADAARLGEIVVVAGPGRGLEAHLSTGGQALPFAPDLFLADWGYGPYYHQTILARRGTWYLVPLPVLGAGWIDGETWRGERESRVNVEAVQAGDVITAPHGDLVVLGIQGRVLVARPEQPADMWCEPGKPPAVAPWRELRIPFEELFDSAGRLLLSYKYMKGC